MRRDMSSPGGRRVTVWWERHPRLVDAMAVLFWILLVGASLAFSLRMLEQQAERVAWERARMLFDVVETTRLWNARHGGLYAPAGPDTEPNPYLDDPQRDVHIGGVLYTKINPAYMTRQLSELVQGRQGVTFSITSLTPINPANRPDAWEVGALKRFENGEGEILELVGGPTDGQFRFMAPLVTEEPCLQCHRKQDYQLGDIRGGISVSMPAVQVFDEFAVQRRQLLVLHGVMFMLLTGGTLMFLARVRRNWTMLAAAKAEQEAKVTQRTTELREVNEALKRSNTELETFAYAISHDLQEPLRMVGSYAGVIQRRYGNVLDAEGREFLGYLTGGAERMRGMINDLLAYSRVDRQALEAQPVELQTVADAALGNLAAAVRETGAVVHVDLHGRSVLGDASQLLRLLQNLLGNALKYAHPERAPIITMTAEPAGPGMLRVTVADNGLGVPAEARERVFGIFQRLNRNASPGTGMGLALCRRIVERHGGRIWVENAEGGGAAFRFTLPQAEEEEARNGTAAAHPAAAEET